MRRDVVKVGTVRRAAGPSVPCPRLRASLVLGAVAVALSGCGASAPGPLRVDLPGEPGRPLESSQVVELSRAVDLTSFDQLTERASAIVVAVPTGDEHEVPLPPGYGDAGSAPTPFVTMRVVEVVDGAVSGATIDVVSPATDAGTGRQVLAGGGPYLLVLAPAMYDADDPAGGYVAVGGLAGVYAADDETRTFRAVSVDDAVTPAVIVLGETRLPAVTRSEHELLVAGP